MWEGLIQQRFPDDDDYLKVGPCQWLVDSDASTSMRLEVTAARASIKTAGWLLGGIAAVIAWLLYRLPPVVTAALETIRADQG